MKLISIFTALFAAASVAYAATADELDINVTHTPTDCPIKSKKGDLLSMQ
jgi:hypothetical protein